MIGKEDAERPLARATLSEKIGSAVFDTACAASREVVVRISRHYTIPDSENERLLVFLNFSLLYTVIEQQLSLAEIAALCFKIVFFS